MPRRAALPDEGETPAATTLKGATSSQSQASPSVPAAEGGADATGAVCAWTRVATRRKARLRRRRVVFLDSGGPAQRSPTASWCPSTTRAMAICCTEGWNVMANSVSPAMLAASRWPPIWATVDLTIRMPNPFVMVRS